MAGKRDSEAPGMLVADIKDPVTGLPWGQMMINAKQFSTGSVGFYAQGKLQNPNNPDARYQSSAQLVLIGSKG